MVKGQGFNTQGVIAQLVSALVGNAAARPPENEPLPPTAQDIMAAQAAREMANREDRFLSPAGSRNPSAAEVYYDPSTTPKERWWLEKGQVPERFGYLVSPEMGRLDQQAIQAELAQMGGPDPRARR